MVKNIEKDSPVANTSDTIKPTEPKTEVLEATTRVKVTKEMVLNYINLYKDIAKNNMVQHGIPSSICLGQGILESGAGTGPLSAIANNHFGIKCHQDWKGPSVKYDDDAAQECFRKYNQASESYNDHALFLKSRKWYDPLFKLGKDDFKGWARGLKAAGYATDPKYPEKLIAIIERYHLDQYDAEVLGKEYVAPVDQPVVKKKEYEVIKGDTMYSISKKFNISIEDLKSKNNISDNTISVGQILVLE
jgi:flagellum-specific peptidoglycan hydrolase FlgJ